MSDRPFCIFVVDDDSLQRLIVSDHLQGHGYQVHEFDSGAGCLAAMDLRPNLILLDIEMPGQNGLDTCRQLRAENYDEVQVIFVSAHDDLETLLAAFEAGGNDFIPKNAAKDVLLRKVEIAIEAEEQKRQLQQQLSYAQKTAFTAMSSLGETGLVLQFLRSSFQCLSLQALGQLLVETMDQFGLHVLIKLHCAGQECFFRSDANCTELEKSILSYAAKLGRISQTGDRLALNYPNITLLATGLDVEDAELMGRLRDHLAIIAEGVGVRIDAMVMEQERLQQANARMAGVKELVDLIAEIEANQARNYSQLEHLIEQHRIEMEDAFVFLALTDSQELQLHAIVDRLVTQVETLFVKDNHLALRLHGIVEKQRQLLRTA
ncbi:response regulator [Methylomonas sp. SURF-2]|uniref:Response regulator n=1 Tax=Methylomonas subterranea TaxID=2952225 RepID=A0ABT1TIB1_9GAMM|nr:response regulator [Methylomonas sp. SURF-2]MCQ8105207.1 response regulator [Methylomonas sp. SURF-2]